MFSFLEIKHDLMKEISHRNQYQNPRLRLLDFCVHPLSLNKYWRKQMSSFSLDETLK